MPSRSRAIRRHVTSEELQTGCVHNRHTGTARGLCVSAWQASKVEEWQHAAAQAVSDAAHAVQRGVYQVGVASLRPHATPLSTGCSGGGGR